MQHQTIVRGIKVSDFPDKELTVQGIFLHNHNWDVYRVLHNSDLRLVEINEVTKMLECRDEIRGFIECYCDNCSTSRTIHFGCNSRICSRCGKRHSDNWAIKISKVMYDVPHRHVVLSMPDRLWELFSKDRSLLKVLMDSVIETLNNVFSHFLRRDIQVGAIVVLHPYSRDLSSKPHVHNLITEGGFDSKGNFIRKKVIPYNAMRKVWQYTILTNLKEALPKTKENAVFIDHLFKDYPNGFYAHLPKKSRIISKRYISKYVGRYIRHPAIANYRLYGYDGEKVTFWYKDNQKIIHYKTMEVFEFIQAIIQHIPDRHFKMIRHYGAYCRKWKKKYRRYLSLESLTQANLDDFNKICRWICPKCGSTMRVIWFQKKGPPDSSTFGEKLSDWQVILNRVDALQISITE